jgi:hypothetical protein
VALAEIEVVDGLEVELGRVPDLAKGDVVLIGLAVGDLGLGEIGERDQELLTPLVELGEPGLQLLELPFQRARLLPRLRELWVVDLAGPGRLLDLRRELVLLRSDRVDTGVELTAPLVDGDQLVELLAGAPSAQC